MKTDVRDLPPKNWSKCYVRITEENLQKEAAQWHEKGTSQNRSSENSTEAGVLNREVFDTLLEAKVLVKRWRREYNHIRPHSSLGYRPPAPEAIIPMGA